MELLDISQKISHFFTKQLFTSTYKPIIFQAILYNIKNNYVIKDKNLEIIKFDDISNYFLKFNYVLYKRFKLRQLNNQFQNVDIYNIIKRHFSQNKDKKLKIKDISPDILKEVKNLLQRHVIFLLRKDMHIYDFYDDNRQMISLKPDIKNEQEFKGLIKEKIIEYLGFSQDYYNYLNHYYPILEKANLGVCTEFLEKFNTVPKLYSKLLVAAESFHAIRNISPKDKIKLASFQNNRCFYCEKEMRPTSHADHFIPYDYLFDSPIWNIVGACRSCNLKKSDYLVNKKFLEKLVIRNEEKFFQEIFKTLFNKFGKDIQLINKELEQHYNNCSIYFKFLRDF